MEPTLPTMSADAHARRVTLTLAARSSGVHPSVPAIVSRLAADGWDWSSLSKSDLEHLYGALDNDTTKTIRDQWDVRTPTIRDWGHPFDERGNLHPWCQPAHKREVDCELCGHKHNRWEFEATNTVNGRTVWMGSTCVEKWGFVVDGEATAEAALERLRGALSVAKRAQARAEWRTKYADHDNRIAMLTAAQHAASRPMTYTMGRHYGVYVKGWRARCKAFVSEVKAVRKYYSQHGFLTPARTARIWSDANAHGHGPLLTEGMAIVTVWQTIDAGKRVDVGSKPEPSKPDPVSEYWDKVEADCQAVLNSGDRAFIARKRKWKDGPDRLRDWERERVADMRKRARRATAPVAPPPRVTVTEEAGRSAADFAARRRAMRAAKTGQPGAQYTGPADDFSDLPWND